MIKRYRVVITIITVVLCVGVGLRMTVFKKQGIDMSDFGKYDNCPECRERVLRYATVCKHCGYRGEMAYSLHLNEMIKPKK